MTCPSCSHSLDDLRSVNPDEVPEPGDGIACPCGALLEIVDETTARLLTQEEIDSMDEDEKKDVDFAQRVIVGIQGQNVEGNHQ